MRTPELSITEVLSAAAQASLADKLGGRNAASAAFLGALDDWLRRLPATGPFQMQAAIIAAQREVINGLCGALLATGELAALAIGENFPNEKVTAATVFADLARNDDDTKENDHV